MTMPDCIWLADLKVAAKVCLGIGPSTTHSSFGTNRLSSVPSLEGAFVRTFSFAFNASNVLPLHG
jgi:hypothetical protein